MKVVFVMAGLPHYFTLILNKLAKNYRIDLVLIVPENKTNNIGKGVKEDRSVAEFEIIELPEKKMWYGKYFFNDLILTLNKIRPEIVVLSSWPYFLRFALDPIYYRRFRKLGIKLICRDIPFNMPYWGKTWSYYFSGKNKTEGDSFRKSFRDYLSFLGTACLRKIYLPLADAHLNYIDEAKDILSSYGVNRDDIFISANSPDTDSLLEAYEKSSKLGPILPFNPNRIIHVGRLVRWKRVDMLIRTLSDLRKIVEGIELLVLGYGPEEENLKTLADKLGVADSVKFVGGVYDPVELGQYFNSSAVYVLAGMGGLSINDAMCFGKPVICSVADGTEKRLVRNEYNGFIFENGDQQSLNNAILNLLSDKTKVNQFGENSSRIIKNEVNIHTVLNEYMAAFDYVLNKRVSLKLQHLIRSN